VTNPKNWSPVAPHEAERRRDAKRWQRGLRGGRLPDVTSQVGQAAAAVAFIQKFRKSAGAVVARYRIAGNCDCAFAIVTLSGAISAQTVSDKDGYYFFDNLRNGTYTIYPKSSQVGVSFCPEYRTVILLDVDSTEENFRDPHSVVDSRNYATFPNLSRNLNGTLIYDVQQFESRKAGAPQDCRFLKPVDCRVPANIPENSRH
jgi:hypothetical protein